MTRRTLEELKRQIPLLEYLQAHDWQQARPIGFGRFLGLCPLHADHAPSFLGDPSKNLFHCYGCRRGGDIIRFVELYYQVKFPEAVALLHQWRGLPPLLHEVSGVNYFFGLTTTISPYQRQLLLESSAARSARRRAKPACGPVSVLREKPWRWESGKTCFWFFHFSIRPRRRSCGNVGISPAVGEISKGLVERGGSLLLAFHAFHSPGISTALFPGVFCFGRRPQTHSASPWLSAC